MVLATGNLGKVREISQLIGDVVELVPYEGELPEETGTTYAENAYIKAKAAFDKYHLPSLADDSGLKWTSSEDSRVFTAIGSWA